MAGTLPSITPTRATGKTTQTRNLVADLGDGYTQRAGDGINTIKEMWSVEWSALDTTTANTLISFFEAREGYINFLWTPFRQSSPRKFICKSWSESFSGNSLTNVSAEFEEVFDEA